MKLTADSHTHTPYSHGKNTVDENAAAAAALGLKQIAITDHGYSHIVMGLRRRETQAIKKECQDAAEKYGLSVLLGMETNVRGVDGVADIKPKDYDNFDVFLCGYHICVNFKKLGDWMHGFWGNVTHTYMHVPASKALIKYNTKSIINTIKKNPVDCITHLTFMCPCDYLEVAKAAADYGTYIELNAKKEHLTDEQLAEIIQKTDVRFIVNSDAHSADRVGDCKKVEEQLSRFDFPMDRIDNIEGRLPNFRLQALKAGK